MSSHDKSNANVAITVAVIGVVGTLGAALFSNWDKFSPVLRLPGTP